MFQVPSQHFCIYFQGGKSRWGVFFFNFIISTLYSSGAPISQHQLRYSLFDVDNYAFTGRLFAATIISARE